MREGAIRLRPRRRRRAAARPAAGWGLVSEAAQRLGLWEQLFSHAARRAFSVACHKLVPRLEPQARAESLEGDGRVLIVRVSSSAVASELVYVKDLLLEQVNAELGKLCGPPRATGRGKPGDAERPRPRLMPRPMPLINRLQYRVGPVKALPDHAAWCAERPRKAPRARPRAPLDLEVVATLKRVQDEGTRDALAALYAAATAQGERTAPPPTGRPPRR